MISLFKNNAKIFSFFLLCMNLNPVLLTPHPSHIIKWQFESAFIPFFDFKRWKNLNRSCIISSKGWKQAEIQFLYTGIWFSLRSLWLKMGIQQGVEIECIHLLYGSIYQKIVNILPICSDIPSMYTKIFLREISPKALSNFSRSKGLTGWNPWLLAKL